MATRFDPFASAPVARVVETTDAQREIWLADRLGREASLAYDEAIELAFAGELDVAALRRALDALLRRHEALRGSFSRDGLSMFFAAEAACALAVHELAALPADARALERDARRLAMVAEPYDLEHGPLFRAELLVLGQREHVLLLGAHHIVCDGWSWGVLVADLARLYAAERAGAPAALEPAESFADYAAERALAEASPAQAADERWWTEQFAGGAPVLDLPLDRPRPPHRTFASERLDHDLPRETLDALRRVAARQGATLPAALLGAFGMLLRRLAGADEVVVGMPAAGQPAADRPGLVGHCVNLLPIRLAPPPEASAADALRDAREALLAATEHQSFTFGTLLRRLALARDPGRPPLVAVLLNVDRAIDATQATFPGLEFECTSIPRCAENFDLFVNAVQTTAGLRLEWQYDAVLFERHTIARWARGFETLLEGLVADPGRRACALPLVDAVGLEELRALQPPPAPYPRERLVHEWFERSAAGAGEQVAVRFGARSLTYRALAARADAVAAALVARGIGPGRLVGLHVPREPDLVAALLGILKAGAGYVALDPAYPRERLAYMAEDAALATVVSSRRLGSPLLEPARTLYVEDLVPGGDAPRERATPDHPAYVIYTSGSTGRPKGVVVPHRAVANLLATLQQRPGLAPGDRLLAVTTPSFDIHVFELLLPLAVGAEIVLADADTARDGTALVRLLDASGANVMQATPAGWRMLLEAGWQGRAGFRAVSGGEPLAPDLAQALLARAAEVWNGYGPTETTVYSTFWRVRSPEAGISIGTPVGNTSVWIVDRAGLPCPIGVPGEICIGGAGVADGYLGRPELTAERFVPDPYAAAPGARLYRTGDRGRWRHDGRLEHLGRLDFQLKLRGFRIEPGEIEAVLLQHPAVARAVVVAREDGPGDPRLVAYWVAAGAPAAAPGPAPGTSAGSSQGDSPGRSPGDSPAGGPDAEALREHLRRLLPEWMVPAAFVRLPRIPLLPNGKVDRAALPAPAAPFASRATRAAPRGDTERRVLALMEATLALPGLGVDDDFFALGGHSLLASQLTARLNREFGCELPLSTLFERPTAARLAAVVDAARAAGGHGAGTRRAPIVRRAERLCAPATLMQRRLWFLEQLNPGRPTYHSPSAHRLRGPLDVARFAGALQSLVDRQEALRTCFVEREGELEQRVEPALSVGLEVEDLAALPAAEREPRLATRLEACTAEPFDLRRAPLFRARLFRLAPDEHVLFFMPHHIVWDGWSFDLFYAELAELYDAALQSRPAALPALEVGYGDFAAWHAEWLGSEEVARELAAWRARLAAAGPVRPLPTDRPHGPGMSGRGETEWLALDAATVRRLREVGARADATLYMTTLAGYCVLLHSMSGVRDVVVGTPVRARSAAELEHLMGFFVNLLPVHVPVDAAQPFVELVREVRRRVLEAFAHPDVPFEKIAEAHAAAGGAGRTVLYQALFSYQDTRQRVRRWGNVDHEQVHLFQKGATEDFGLWLLEHVDGIAGGVTFNADVFHAATARRLRACYLDILAAAAARPDATVAELAELAELAAPAGLAASAGAAEAGEQRTTMQPTTPTERQLAALWQELLGLPRIGLTDNFFELGGHSLLAMQVIDRMATLTGKRIAPRRLVFENLGQLAAHYDATPVERPRGLLQRLFGRGSAGA